MSSNNFGQETQEQPSHPSEHINAINTTQKPESSSIGTPTSASPLGRSSDFSKADSPISPSSSPTKSSKRIVSTSQKIASFFSLGKPNKKGVEVKKSSSPTNSSPVFDRGSQSLDQPRIYSNEFDVKYEAATRKSFDSLDTRHERKPVPLQIITTQPAPASNFVKKHNRKPSEHASILSPEDNQTTPLTSTIYTSPIPSSTVANAAGHSTGVLPPDEEHVYAEPESSSPSKKSLYHGLFKGRKSPMKANQSTSALLNNTRSFTAPTVGLTTYLSPKGTKSLIELPSPNSGALSPGVSKFLLKHEVGLPSSSSPSSASLLSSSPKRQASRSGSQAGILAAGSLTQPSFLGGNSLTETSPVRTPEVKETHVMVRDYDPETGNKMINQYMIVKELGRGVHGKVKLCVDAETNEYWAIKIVEKRARRRFQSRLSSAGRRLSPALAPSTTHSDDTSSPTSAVTPPTPPSNPHLDKIRREIAILKKCNHPNVVKLKEVIDDPGAEKIYLVLEYMAGGDIKWHNEKEPPNPVMTENDARKILRDVLCGIQYLHYQGIVHRDIKPANLLWSADGRVKISDFGVSVLTGRRFGQRRRDLLANLPSGLSTPTGTGNRPKKNPTTPKKNTMSKKKPIKEREEEVGQLLGVSSGDEDEVDGDFMANELELAKTAGSPAFFAPELCSFGEDDRDQLLKAVGLANASTELKKQNSLDVTNIENTTRIESVDVSVACRKPTVSTIMEKGETSPLSNDPTPNDDSDVHSRELAKLRLKESCQIFASPPISPDSLGSSVNVPASSPSLNDAVSFPIGHAIDIWALGVTLFCFIFGRVPFIAETEFELFNIICKKPLEFPPNIPISAELQDLLSRLLEKNPLYRITIEEAKLHPWTTQDLMPEEKAKWISETDPETLFGARVTVTDEEVRGAFKLLSRIRQRIRKLSSSFQNLAAGFSLGRKTKSSTSISGMRASMNDKYLDDVPMSRAQSKHKKSISLHQTSSPLQISRTISAHSEAPSGWSDGSSREILTNEDGREASRPHFSSTQPVLSNVESEKKASEMWLTPDEAWVDKSNNDPYLHAGYTQAPRKFSVVSDEIYDSHEDITTQIYSTAQYTQPPIPSHYYSNAESEPLGQDDDDVVRAEQERVRHWAQQWVADEDGDDLYDDDLVQEPQPMTDPMVVVEDVSY